jgi:hypothetical protein
MCAKVLGTLNAVKIHQDRSHRHPVNSRHVPSLPVTFPPWPPITLPSQAHLPHTSGVATLAPQASHLQLARSHYISSASAQGDGVYQDDKLRQQACCAESGAGGVAAGVRQPDYPSCGDGDQPRGDQCGRPGEWQHCESDCRHGECGCEGQGQPGDPGEGAQWEERGCQCA